MVGEETFIIGIIGHFSQSKQKENLYIKELRHYLKNTNVYHYPDDAFNCVKYIYRNSHIVFPVK